MYFRGSTAQARQRQLEYVPVGWPGQWIRERQMFGARPGASNTRQLRKCGEWNLAAIELFFDIPGGDIGLDDMIGYFK